VASSVFPIASYFCCCCPVFTLLPSLLGPAIKRTCCTTPATGQPAKTTDQPTNNFSGHDTKIDSMSSLFGSLIDMSNQAAEMCPQNAASNDTDNETSQPNHAAFRLPL